MKKFLWIRLLDFHKGEFLSLFQLHEEPWLMTTWGSVLPHGDKFQPVITNPITHINLTTEELMSLKDAKEAVEKKLFDDGVIEDGDIVEDRTE